MEINIIKATKYTITASKKSQHMLTFYVNSGQPAAAYKLPLALLIRFSDGAVYLY